MSNVNKEKKKSKCVEVDASKKKEERKCDVRLDASNPNESTVMRNRTIRTPLPHPQHTHNAQFPLPFFHM
jgi:hypothetical protein